MTEKVLAKGDSASVPCIIESNKETTKEDRLTIWVILAVIATLLGSGLPAGYCLGVINTPQEIIRAWIKSTVKENSGQELTETEELSMWALIVSVYVVGAIIGSPTGALLADKGGRRLGIFVNHTMCLIASILCAWCKAAESVHMLIYGRFIAGLCSGLSTSLMPMYLSEVAPVAVRGVMGVLFPMGMCLGVLLSQILGMECILGTKDHWQYLVGGFGLPALVALLLQPTLPDSPAYCFIILGDENRGHKALIRLRGGSSKAVEAEALKLIALRNENENIGNTWNILRVLKSKQFRLPLLITVLFNAGQQFSGINAVFYYSTLIFRSAGLNILESQGASIGAGTINWVTSIAAIPLIRYSRRRLLFLGSVAMCVISQAVLLASLALIPTSSFASYIAIAAVMAYVFVYNLGLGPIPFMIATELFPAGPRTVGISAGSTSNWLSNLIVGFTFPLIQAQIGEYSFTLFMLSSCLLWFFTYKFLPETLGKEDLPSCSPTEEESEGTTDKFLPYIENSENPTSL